MSTMHSPPLQTHLGIGIYCLMLNLQIELPDTVFPNYYVYTIASIRPNLSTNVMTLAIVTDNAPTSRDDDE